jgi:malate synthase
MEIFDKKLGEKPNQKDIMREDVQVSAEMLLDMRIEGGKVTEKGMRNNINVTLQYLNAWLNGNGAAAIHNLMEDTATAEISRAQLWQWIHNQAPVEGGTVVDRTLYERIRDEEIQALGGLQEGRLRDACEILDAVVFTDEFIEFLTYIAYNYLD